MTDNEANAWRLRTPIRNKSQRLGPSFYLVSCKEMPGPRSTGSNTYTCTCVHFCGGYKTGLSRATYYRHSPYRDASAAPSQPSFSTSFQNFLDNSAGDSGPISGSGQSGQSGVGHRDWQPEEESQGNTDGLEVPVEFPTSPGSQAPHVIDGFTQNFKETSGVNPFF